MRGREPRVLSWRLRNQERAYAGGNVCRRVRACMRALVRVFPPSGSSSRSLAGYIQRARLPSYRAATLAFVDSAKCPWIFPGLPMPADQPDIGGVVRASGSSSRADR